VGDDDIHAGDDGDDVFKQCPKVAHSLLLRYFFLNNTISETLAVPLLCYVSKEEKVCSRKFWSMKFLAFLFCLFSSDKKYLTEADALVTGQNFLFRGEL
jgi:hypothetical protein